MAYPSELLPIFILVCHVLLLQVHAVPQLKQVHVITRHGIATPSPKSEGTADTLLELAGGSTLTPQGQRQLYDVGRWLRQVYDSNSFLQYYDASEVRLESSDLEMTLSSASALSLGLFPYKAQAGNHGENLYESMLPEMPGLPVYSVKDSNDIFFRAYHYNCPVFEARLQKLYTSLQWTTLESNNQGLLTKLASLFPEDRGTPKISNGKVVLKYLGPYYDMIKVARTECLLNRTAYACTSLGSDIYNLRDALSDAEFDELETLMGSSEAMKYGIATAGNLLGSQLLWRMLQRINDTTGKFFLYSAHGPTLLSLMSTLQEWSTAERLPSYSSAIIMEVYQETDASKAYSIRFLYRAADMVAAKYIPLTRANCERSFVGDAPSSFEPPDEGLFHCLLDDFVVWATANTLMKPEDWCTACENESADVCLQALVHKQNAVERAFEEFSSAFDDDQQRNLIIAGTFFGGFFTGLLVWGLATIFRRRHMAKMEKSVEESSNKIVQDLTVPTEIETPVMHSEMN